MTMGMRKLLGSGNIFLLICMLIAQVGSTEKLIKPYTYGMYIVLYTYVYYLSTKGF